MWTDYGYDSADRLTSVVNKRTGPVTLSSFTYTLDATGSRTQMVDLSGSHSYQYDPLYRLTQVTYPGPQTDTYTYDGVGNRLTMNAAGYTYDAADQMLTAGAVAYGYDNNGNQTSRGLLDTFTYDHENRLTQAVTGGVLSSSIYNGDGVRMSHTVGVVTTNYSWDVNASLPVVLQDGLNTYVYGLDLISSTDALGAQTYFAYDGLGSTTDLTNGSGTVTGTYSYDVFGAVRAQTGGGANYWQFTGEQTDADSGLQYLRARYYDTATGRFLGRDPLMIGNRYSYVEGNPTNYVDPYGLFSVGGVDVTPDFVDDAADSVADVVSDTYHDPANAAAYLDGLSLTINVYVAGLVDISAAIGCTVGPGGCAAGYLAAYFGTAPAQMFTNFLSVVSTGLTCVDWLGIIGDKEGSSFTDCAVSASTSYFGAIPEPNISAVISGYQVCYDVGKCSAWWTYNP